MAEIGPTTTPSRLLIYLAIGLGVLLACGLMAFLLLLLARTDTPEFIWAFTGGLGRKGLALGPIIVAGWFFGGGALLFGKERVTVYPFLAWLLATALYVNWAVTMVLGILALIAWVAWNLIQADKKFSAVALVLLAVNIATGFITLPAVQAISVLDPGTWRFAGVMATLSCVVSLAFLIFAGIAIFREWISINAGDVLRVI